MASQKQCTTVSGSPRHEAARKARSSTGIDRSEPSAPTTTPRLASGSGASRTTTTGQCALRTTADETDPSTRLRTRPAPAGSEDDEVSVARQVDEQVAGVVSNADSTHGHRAVPGLDRVLRTTDEALT